MAGFSKLFEYPNHSITLSRTGGTEQLEQKGTIVATRKNGNQQKTKAPIMIPKVLAELLNLPIRLLLIRVLLLLLLWLNLGSHCGLGEAGGVFEFDDVR